MKHGNSVRNTAQMKPPQSPGRLFCRNRTYLNLIEELNMKEQIQFNKKKLERIVRHFKNQSQILWDLSEEVKEQKDIVTSLSKRQKDLERDNKIDYTLPELLEAKSKLDELDTLRAEVSKKTNEFGTAKNHLVDMSEKWEEITRRNAVRKKSPNSYDRNFHEITDRYQGAII